MYNVSLFHRYLYGEKEKDLTQSSEKNTNRKFEKSKVTTLKRHQKLRLHNDYEST